MKRPLRRDDGGENDDVAELAVTQSQEKHAAVAIPSSRAADMEMVYATGALCNYPIT